jgi:hypothetical protein
LFINKLEYLVESDHHPMRNHSSDGEDEEGHNSFENDIKQVNEGHLIGNILLDDDDQFEQRSNQKSS